MPAPNIFGIDSRSELLAVESDAPKRLTAGMRFYSFFGNEKR
jgi:hypothetical protein